MIIQQLTSEHSQTCNISNYFYKPGFHFIYLHNAEPPTEVKLQYSLWLGYYKRTFELIDRIHRELKNYD